VAHFHVERFNARQRDARHEKNPSGTPGVKLTFVEVPEAQRQTLSRGVLRRAERLALSQTAARDAIGLSTVTWASLHRPHKIPALFDRVTLNKIAAWLRSTRPKEETP
jgi:hypothetical protein